MLFKLKPRGINTEQYNTASLKVYRYFDFVQLNLDKLTSEIFVDILTSNFNFIFQLDSCIRISS